MSPQTGETEHVEGDAAIDCEHPEAAVISDVNGDHFCARCNTEWWEDPL